MLLTRLIPPPMRRESARRSGIVACGGLALAVVVGAVLLSTHSHAQTKSQPVPVAASSDMPWSSLTPAQQTALKPIEREWSSIEPNRKAKWLDVANRMPKMPSEERARVQTRMEDWAKMTPRERGQVRMNYREAQQVPAQERKARWEAYKALPPDEQKQLAARAIPPGRKNTPSEQAAAAEDRKANLVPNSSYAPRPRAVAPTVTQAQPGATTNLINKRPSPPAHQQAGLPKIAASPGFVDQSTLLPKRGPQGAATRSSLAASSPTSRP